MRPYRTCDDSMVLILPHAFRADQSLLDLMGPTVVKQTLDVGTRLTKDGQKVEMSCMNGTWSRSIQLASDALDQGKRKQILSNQD